MHEQAGKHNPSGRYLYHQVNSVMWALVLIWSGGVFLLKNLGWLERVKFNPPVDTIFGAGALQAWPLALTGAGAIFLLAAIIMIAIPEGQRVFSGPLILAAVALGIGLGQFFSWSLTGPFILIAVGVSLLIKAAFNR